MTTHITPEIRAALGVARAALEGRDSAYGPADAIVGGLDSAGLLMSPETAAELARLRREHAALVESMTWHPQVCAAGQHRPWFADTAKPLPCPWCQIAELQAADRPAYVYRAEHDSIPMGTYRTREAARGHITAELDAEGATGTRGWVPDFSGDDAPEDLILFGPGEDDETCTGYVVTPVPVLDAYDPEAEG